MAFKVCTHKLIQCSVLAGEAGTGIGELISQALVKQAAAEGATLTLEEARQHCYFMDSQGVINATRSDTVSGKLAAHKVPWPAKQRPCHTLD